MEEAPLTVVIAQEDTGDRLDRVLAARLGSRSLDGDVGDAPAALSRSRLKALILDGQVTLAGHIVRDPGHRVHAGEEACVTVPPPEPATPQGQDIPLTVVYEDDDIIVIDKPRGLVVHPAAGHADGTLVNALIAHCGASLSGIGGVRRPGIVHRLDKDTTGLLVAAKNDRAHQALSAQFADHGRTGPLQRGYLAFVWGTPDLPRGTIDKPIDRHPYAREKMAVRESGREAITHYERMEEFSLSSHGPRDLSRQKPVAPVASLIECRLETGRTHQIRVHMAASGHPLIGDETYGPGFRTKAAVLGRDAQAIVEGLGRQALHAYLLGLEHPATGAFLLFKSELPADLTALRQSLLRGTKAGGIR